MVHKNMKTNDKILSLVGYVKTKEEEEEEEEEEKIKEELKSSIVGHH